MQDARLKTPEKSTGVPIPTPAIHFQSEIHTCSIEFPFSTVSFREIPDALSMFLHIWYIPQPTVNNQEPAVQCGQLLDAMRDDMFEFESPVPENRFEI